MSEDDLEGIKRSLVRRLRSTTKLATTAARLATRRLMGWEGQRDQQLGEALARELDQMKGMAMKIGQILSYFDGVLPEGTHAALRKLQQGQRPVAFATMADVMLEAFGRPHGEVFEFLDPQPVAAASIGQVYRGRFRGQDVAVKVQYPEIGTTVAGDFSRLEAIAKLASLASAVDGPALVEELRERFLEECDYLREAAFQEAFRRRFLGDPRVVIPAVVTEASRRTVLTTEWQDGLAFYRFAEEADASRKNDAAVVLANFAHRCLFGLGTVNADPHPGNYLFRGDERIVFLDFGCTKTFEPDYLAAERRLAQVVVDDRRRDFNDALIACGVVADPGRFDFDVHWQWLCHLYGPYRVPVFRFTREYVVRGMEFGRPSNPNTRLLHIPRSWIWMQRLYWGLHAVLARLEAQADFATGFRDALSSTSQPLEVPRP